MAISIIGVKKVSLPTTNILTLNGGKPAKVSNNVLSGMKTYYIKDQLPNKPSSNKKEEKLLQGVIPIDNEIKNVIYLKNYLEKGLTIKLSPRRLQEAWLIFQKSIAKKDDNNISSNKIEVMTISNNTEFDIPLEETNEETEDTTHNNDSFILTNFDDIFSRLAHKVDGIDKYVNDLKEMRDTVSASSLEIMEERKKLEAEKEAFYKFQADERSRIEKEKEELEKLKTEQSEIIEKSKEELNNNFAKLQSLTSKFNEKISYLNGE